MKNSIKKTICALSASILLVGALYAADVNLKIGVVTPTKHPHSISAQKFAELVAKKTYGEVKITVSDNAALGNNKELVDGVKAGFIDFTIVPPSIVAEYAPAVGILELPYIFVSKEHMLKVTRGKIGKKIAGISKKESGIEILGYMGGAQRNMITTKATIRSIDDLKGLKMRAWPSDTILLWWKNLGALGSVVAFPEVYTALQTGVVDGAENEFSTFTTARWAEVAKNISLTQHFITVRPLIGNAAKLKKLSRKHQKAIREAALEASDFDVELEGKLDKENMEKLASDYGVKFTTPDKAPMIKASNAVIEKFAKDKGLEKLANSIAKAAK